MEYSLYVEQNVDHQLDSEHLEYYSVHDIFDPICWPLSSSLRCCYTVPKFKIVHCVDDGERNLTASSCSDPT